ncbi:hypothetical protein HDU76_004625, partial [Blyttiomyces sp. JEL0837]
TTLNPTNLSCELDPSSRSPTPSPRSPLPSVTSFFSGNSSKSLSSPSPLSSFPPSSPTIARTDGAATITTQEPPLLSSGELISEFRTLIQTYILQGSSRQVTISSNLYHNFLTQASIYLPKQQTGGYDQSLSNGWTSSRSATTRMPTSSSSTEYDINYLDPPSPSLLDPLITYTKQQNLSPHFETFFNDAIKNLSPQVAKRYLYGGVGVLDPMPSKSWRFVMIIPIAITIMGFWQSRDRFCVMYAFAGGTVVDPDTGKSVGGKVET